MNTDYSDSGRVAGPYYVWFPGLGTVHVEEAREIARRLEDLAVEAETVSVTR